MTTSARLTCVLALFVLSACGSTDEPETEPEATRTSVGASPSPARCNTEDLRFALPAGEGAAGSTYYELTMTNASRLPCRTGGFGGVSLVAAPGGEPIGAPADRTRTERTRTLLLQPGDRAHATLRQTDAHTYSAKDCRPRPAAGLRVYPPSSRQSEFVPHEATACAARDVHLLEVTPYVADG